VGLGGAKDKGTCGAPANWGVAGGFVLQEKVVVEHSGTLWSAVGSF
jgi:hypothetical protein